MAARRLAAPRAAAFRPAGGRARALARARAAASGAEGEDAARMREALKLALRAKVRLFLQPACRVARVFRIFLSVPPAGHLLRGVLPGSLCWALGGACCPAAR